MPAAKEEIFVAGPPTLTETRVWGSGLSETTGIGLPSSLSSTSQWGWRYFYDGTASARLVGLDYAVSRYYASAIGRFARSDPDSHSGRLAVPQTLNRYLYSFNDPVNFRDPGGLDPCLYPVPGLSCLGNWPATGTLPTGTLPTLPAVDNAVGAAGGYAGASYDTMVGQLFVDTANLSAARDVDKRYVQTGKCDKTAAQVLSDIEADFASFANTTASVPLTVAGFPVGTLSGIALFASGQIAQGATISASSILVATSGGVSAPPIIQDAGLTVTSVTSTGFTLVPGPGAPLTGSISFSLTTNSDGTVTSIIKLAGDAAGGFVERFFNQFALGAGGGAFEDAIWNNVLQNIVSIR